MKVAILGAAGQISAMLTENLRNETDRQLVPFARNASGRLEAADYDTKTIIDGDFSGVETLRQAISGADIVYLNEMADSTGIENIIEVMEEN